MSFVNKAIDWVVKASRGTLSQYVVNAPHQYGQPLPTAADAQSLITPERMREVVLKTPTVAAAMNAVLDYTKGVKVCVRNRDVTKKAPAAQVARVQAFLDRPNPEDTWRHFMGMLARDMFTLGFAAVEIERNAQGQVANLWVLDAARVKVDYDEHGTTLGYDMLDAHAVPIIGKDGVHAWLPDEVIWFQRNPQSNSRYPSSQIQQLFSSAVVEDLMLAFIGGRFTDSNVPFGVFDLGDISEQELKKAIGLWNGQVQAQHRIMLTGSRGGSKWFPFGYQLKELEAPQLLAMVRTGIMGVLGVSENELGQSEDVNKSNGYNLSYTFKKRAIEPLLDELCDTLTRRLLWEELGLSGLELYYEQIDSRDELLQAQIDDLYHKMGVLSTNDIRNRKGLPDEPGGEVPMLFTGAAWIPVSMANDFALAQLYALIGIDATLFEQIQQAANQGGDQSIGPGDGRTPHLKPLADAPLVRPMQMPERYTTPDGQGSSTAKLKLPRPQPSQAGARPRGPVKTLQQTGLRRDEM